MKKNEFEEYLATEHMKDYHGTDDDAPDAFDNWLTNMDVELMLAYGDRFGAWKALEAVKDFGNALKLKE